MGNLLSLMLQIGQFTGGGDTQSSGFIAAYDLATGKFDDCSTVPGADLNLLRASGNMVGRWVL